MKTPQTCPNPECPCHDYLIARKNDWKALHGTYESAVYGRVRRYRCRFCGKTFTERLESRNYRLHRDDIDIGELFRLWCSGASVNQLARKFHCTTSMVKTRIRRGSKSADAFFALPLYQRLKTSSANAGNRETVITRPSSKTTVPS